MAILRITGACAGELEVELEQWTVSMLRDVLAKRSNSEPNSIQLIFAGRILKESENPNLADIGVLNSAKILVSRINVIGGQSLREQLQEEEELRSARLALLKKLWLGLLRDQLMVLYRVSMVILSTT